MWTVTSEGKVIAEGYNLTDVEISVRSQIGGVIK